MHIYIYIYIYKRWNTASKLTSVSGWFNLRLSHAWGFMSTAHLYNIKCKQHTPALVKSNVCIWMHMNKKVYATRLNQ